MGARRITIDMRAVPEPRAYIADPRVLAKIVDAEASRLSGVIDSARSYRVRQQALEEMKQMAENVLICLEALGQSPDMDAGADLYDLRSAA